MKTAEYYIKKLNLTPHPEGGYFREVYRSDEKINPDALPKRYSAGHNFSTSIFYLLNWEEKSLMHKLKSDEIWHFYEGSPLKLYMLDKEKNLTQILLGRNIDEGEVFQYVIKKDQWFCAEVENKNSFSLVGCTVSPGFDFSDFKIGKRENLFKLFPKHKELIKRFTVG